MEKVKDQMRIIQDFIHGTKMTPEMKDTQQDMKMQEQNSARMTREELEEFLSTHTVYEIAEFIITKQVDRYSAGFDTGYELGYVDGHMRGIKDGFESGLENRDDYYFDWDMQEWTKKNMSDA